MITYEITGVPVPREDAFAFSPVTAIASRLKADDRIELKISAKKGILKVFVTVPDYLSKSVKGILFEYGYSYKTGNTTAETVNSIFVRRAEVLMTPASPFPKQSLVYPPLYTSSLGFDEIYSALRNTDSYCGLIFHIYKHPLFNNITLNSLSAFERTDMNISLDLLINSPERFKVSIGLFCNDDADREYLKTEICHGFSALTPRDIIPSPSTDSLFNRHVTALNGKVSIIENLYTPEECASLTNISASPQRQGLPISKDTLFESRRKHLPNINEKSLYLGSTEYEDFFLPLIRLRQHLFITGSPGSGKGNEIFNLTYQLYKHGIPILLFESAKKEQHHLAKVIENLQVWRPTEGRFLLNPFELPDGVMLKDYKSALLKMIKTCFKLDGPLEELFAKTLNRCYSLYGYTDNSFSTDNGVMKFGLNEFMEEYERVVEESGYSSKTKSDMKTAGKVRLGSLFNENKAVFDTVHSVTDKLLSGSNLIQLNCLTSIESKQLFATMLLISIGAKLSLGKNLSNDKPLKLVIVLDEAHNLLNAASTSDGRTYSFADQFYNMLLEMRSLGVGIIISDQSTKNFDPKISEVCASKLFFGSSPSFNGMMENINVFKADEQAIRYMHTLNPGEGCFHTLGMDRGIYLKTDNVIDNFGLDTDYKPVNKYENSRMFIETFVQCKKCPASGKCTLRDKALGRSISTTIDTLHSSKISNILNDKNKTDKDYILAVGSAIKEIDRSLSEEARYCCVVQFTRDFNREHTVKIKLGDALNIAQSIWSSNK